MLPVEGDRIRNGDRIEHASRRLRDTGEDPPDLAGLLVTAALASPIRHAAEAWQRRKRSIDDPEHLTESDLVGLRRE
jgi:hypothetical protein